MRNFLKCRSLIRVAIMMIVMAFLAGQVTDTYAKENGKESLVNKIREALQGDLDEIRKALQGGLNEIREVIEEIDHHTDNDGGGGDGGCGCPADILPAGGRTIAGPGTSTVGNQRKLIYNNNTGEAQKMCVTVANNGGTHVFVMIGRDAGVGFFVEPGETGSKCGILAPQDEDEDKSKITINTHDDNEFAKARVIWRIDSYDTL